MKAERYPAYKDSGVPWLGEVPAHWEVKRLKYLTDCFGGGTPSKNNVEYWSGDIPWVSPKDMAGQLVMDTEDHITEDAIKESATRLIDPGAVLVVVRSGILRHTIPVAINTLQVALNQDMKALVPHKQLSHEYLKHFIQGLNKPLLDVWSKMGCTVESIESDYMLNSLFPLPPLPEQTAIAAFLDLETARLDTLIGKKQRLIDLLREERAALISQAVTQGLDPAAPLKESGIDWLGRIPAHWEVKRLKHLGRALLGLTYDPSEVVNEGEGTLVLRSSNVQDRKIAFDDNVYVQKDIPEKIITRVGDILICSRNGSRALIGKNAMIDASSAGLTFGAFMTIFRSAANRYLFWVFNSHLFECQSGSFLTSTINQLLINNLYSFEVPLPPLAEQQALILHLDRETARIDTLRAKVETAIERLKEYRAALIAAAVTGKIDVRSAMHEGMTP